MPQPFWWFKGLRSVVVKANAQCAGDIMGSRGKFSEEECCICFRAMEPTSPNRWDCEECCIQRHRQWIQSLLPLQLRKVQEPVITNLVACLMTFDYRHAHRLYFLGNALLARESVFRKFTYFGNGCAGSIDQWTNVLDHIVGFLTKYRHGCELLTGL